MSLWYLYKSLDARPANIKIEYITTTDRPHLFKYIIIAVRFSVLLFKNRPMQQYLFYRWQTFLAKL